MVQAYNILMKEGFQWSTNFKKNMKSQLLNLLLEYFSDIEHYEKCSKLKSIIEKLENVNEIDSKTITSGSQKY